MEQKIHLQLANKRTYYRINVPVSHATRGFGMVLNL